MDCSLSLIAGFHEGADELVSSTHLVQGDRCFWLSQCACPDAPTFLQPHSTRGSLCQVDALQQPVDTSQML